MAQTSPRTCRNCGTPLASGQRFCSNCGTLAEEGTSTPTTRSNEGYSPVPDMSTMMSNIPLAPPPPDNQSFSSYTEAQQYASESTQVSQPQTPPVYQPAPDYAKPQSATPILRRIGCGLGVLIILFLALCGTGGYFAFHAIQNAFKNTPSSISNTGSSQGTGAGYGTTATAGTVTTTPINETFTYSSITITILDVKQAQSFSDDTSGDAQVGVLRLDIKEQNSTNVQPGYVYGQVMRLILPNQNKVSPSNAQDNVSPDAATARTNWIDFIVPVTTNVAQTTLQLGDDTQAQMNVPLSGHADLSKYQAKVVTVNESAQYADLKWTLKTATRSWSNQGKQATKGMYYLVLDLSVDNPSSIDYSENWGNYSRVSAGDVTSNPDNSMSTIPITFNAYSSNKEGTEAFLVPQGVTSYTFILLQDPSFPKASQMTIHFQI